MIYGLARPWAIMETRKVQVTGGSTYTVSLPKDWATENDVSAGSAVALYPEDDVLVYHGNPLETPVTIAGAMKFVANIVLDVPDTDIAAQVQAVLPGGDTLVLGTDAVRARFRDGPEPELVEPDQCNLERIAGNL
jgi:predicted acyl esterase